MSILAQPSNTRLDASVSIFIGIPKVNILKYSGVMYVVLSLLKASSAFLLYTNSVSFCVSYIISITIFKKSLIN